MTVLKFTEFWTAKLCYFNICILHFFIILYNDQQMHTIFHKLSHCYMFRHYRVILRELVINAFNTCTVHLLLFCTMTNKCTIISQIITLLHVSTLSCHPQGWGACNQCSQYMYLTSFIILYNDQQMHNYFTSYHTATYFDTLVSSSGRLKPNPCQVTQVFQMQMLVKLFTIKTFQVGFCKSSFYSSWNVNIKKN